MTPIESIYEIEETLIDLRKYLHSKEILVTKKARKKYEKLVDRFFSENVSVVDSEQRYHCLHDDACFVTLMKSTTETYYSDNEYSP
jgi:16S rRNA C1402 (ribose-2'-O) methylase RsmI